MLFITCVDFKLSPSETEAQGPGSTKVTEEEWSTQPGHLTFILRETEINKEVMQGDTKFSAKR